MKNKMEKETMALELLFCLEYQHYSGSLNSAGNYLQCGDGILCDNCLKQNKEKDEICGRILR